MADKIMTLHPRGKQGVRIDKDKYELVRQAILAALADQGEMTFSALGEAVERRLDGQFEGSVSWYYTTVKLDLEARGMVVRVGGSGPQRLALP